MHGQYLPANDDHSLSMAAMGEHEILLLTVLTSSQKAIVKRFREVDGAVEIIPAAQIHRGHAETVAVDGPASLLTLIENLKPNQALSLGRLPQVGQRYSLASQSLRREGDITRSKEFFDWNDGPGLMLLDADTKGIPDAVLRAVAGRCLAEVIG